MKNPWLSQEQKVQICKWLGEFKRHDEIAELMKQEWGWTRKTPDLQYYLQVSKWRPLVDRYRAAYMAAVTEIPIAHERVRLQRLESQWEQCSQEPQRRSEQRRLTRAEQRAILGQAREETQRLRDVNILAVQFTQMTDAQLLQRSQQLVQHIESLGGTHDLLPQTVELTKE